MAEQEKKIPKGTERQEGQNLLDKQRWAPHESASHQGRLIKTEQAIKFLKEKFPGFNFAIWDDNDVAREVSNGWEVWTSAHWNEVEKWNASSAGRHQITEHQGALRLGVHDWICGRPKEISDLKSKQENERRESSLKGRLGSLASAMPTAARAEGRLVIDTVKAGTPDPELQQLLAEQGPKSP